MLSCLPADGRFCRLYVSASISSRLGTSGYGFCVDVCFVPSEVPRGGPPGAHGNSASDFPGKPQTISHSGRAVPLLTRTRSRVPSGARGLSEWGMGHVRLAGLGLCSPQAEAVQDVPSASLEPGSHLEPGEAGDAVLARVSLVPFPSWLSVGAGQALGSWEPWEPRDELISLRALTVPGVPCSGRQRERLVISSWGAC